MSLKRSAIPALTLLLACQSPTGPEVGDKSRCQRQTAALIHYAIPNDPSTYALEVGLCAYKSNAPRPDVMTDTVTIYISQAELVAAAQRVR